ncbi:MAG: hypothetical protein J6N52_04960 [Clostridia bacterium]|nr:hypothetical protein [Clostridia bacterium]
MLQNKVINKIVAATLLCFVLNCFSCCVPVLGDSDCSFNFDDGTLDEKIFSNEMFAVENKKIKAITSESSFSIPDIKKNSSIEFKLKPTESGYIPKFNVKIGNASVSYINDNRISSSWNDKISLYNRVTGGNAVSSVFADGTGNTPEGTFFPDKGEEYTIRFDSYENIHYFFINGNLIVSGACEGILNEYNAEVILYGAADKVYIDDITVKELKSKPNTGGGSFEEDTETDIVGSTYLYTFDDGLLPKEFSSDNFCVEDGRLKTISPNGSFTLKDLHRNGYVEFNIEAAADCTIPDLTFSLRNGELAYTSNAAVDKAWDDVFKLRNAEDNWSQIAELWNSGKGSFFPEKDGGYTIKYMVDGDTYSLFIDGVLKMSADCPTVSSKQSFDMTIIYGDGKGAIKNGIFYLDDIVASGIYPEKECGIPKLPELSNEKETELYFQGFDDTLLNKCDGIDYKDNEINNGILYVKSGNGFVIPSSYSNHRLEMDMKLEKQEKLKIKYDMKKNLSGSKYEIIYEDSDTTIPGSKWTFSKKDSDGKIELAAVNRDVDDIVSSEFRNIAIECLSNTIAVFVDGELVADAPSAMLKGVDYSSYSYTEFYPYRSTEEDEVVLVDNIRLSGYQMDVNDAVSCVGQKFFNDGKQVNSISELRPGKVKVEANISSIDMNNIKNVTAIMVMFKDGYLSKAIAKPVSLPKMRFLPAKTMKVQLEMDVTEKDLSGNNTQFEFYVWDDINNMTSCGGLSKLNQ